MAIIQGKNYCNTGGYIRAHPPKKPEKKITHPKISRIRGVINDYSMTDSEKLSIIEIILNQ